MFFHGIRQTGPFLHVIPELVHDFCKFGVFRLVHQGAQRTGNHHARLTKVGQLPQHDIAVLDADTYQRVAQGILRGLCDIFLNANGKESHVAEPGHRCALVFRLDDALGRWSRAFLDFILKLGHLISRFPATACRRPPSIAAPPPAWCPRYARAASRIGAGFSSPAATLPA